MYSKDTRFLYELIQNAEDNCYSSVTANGKKPFLAFEIYKDKIIIDSNEDGFSENDIIAISSTGNSTKKQRKGYIGEKGIGFKSVFKIAKKVHIQSRPFSFVFRHTKEDDDGGLGLITPYSEDPKELPEDVRTRITLFLNDTVQSVELADDLRQIPHTLLMFLTQIQELSISICLPDQPVWAVRYLKEEIEKKQLFITKINRVTTEVDNISTTEQKYYTMKSDLDDLPADEARTYRDGSTIDSTTVVLAFPIDDHSEPIVEQQHTYAFLPLGSFGFRFLIQADFITQASREDVVHSKRNVAILDGVADLFVKSIFVLYKRSLLKYTWMRYLPDESITNEFWAMLRTKIQKKLKNPPILESWSGNGPYRLTTLRRVPAIFLDEEGEPLLRDIDDEEVYLSSQYSYQDCKILQKYGMDELTYRLALDRLQADISNPSRSRWMLNDHVGSWRTRICNRLLDVFTSCPKELQIDLKKLKLIPLCDGLWVSTSNFNKFYFPMTTGISIPTDLGLNLIAPFATKNSAWLELLEQMGVRRCQQSYVVDLVHDKYGPSNLDGLQLDSAVKHISYLYLAQSEENTNWAPHIRFINQHTSLLKNYEYLYFPTSEGEYSPVELFRTIDQLPGCAVHYLHEDYVNAVGREIIINCRSWTAWLEEVAGVRRVPKLLNNRSDGLSKELQYIIDYRSDKLLGLLKCHWNYYRRMSDRIKEILQGSKILLENGRRKPMLETFLPLPTLKRIAVELHLSEKFPFLATTETVRDEELQDWTFVKGFCIGIDEDLEFYTQALMTYVQSNKGIDSDLAGKDLSTIYRKIQQTCGKDQGHVR